MRRIDMQCRNHARSVVVSTTFKMCGRFLGMYSVAAFALLALPVAAQQTVFISDFSPRQAQYGDIVKVTGSGFLQSPTPPTHADVGGLPSTAVRVLSDTELEFEVQPHFVTNKI